MSTTVFAALPPGDGHWFVRCARCGSDMAPQHPQSAQFICTAEVEWCQAHPLTGRESTDAGPEWFEDRQTCRAIGSPRSNREHLETLVAGTAERIRIGVIAHPALVAPAEPKPPLALLLSRRVLRSAELVIGDAGITATLSFNGAPFRVAVPWLAVHGIEAEWGDVPASLLGVKAVA